MAAVDIGRAICHEAGHAAVALHFGFRVASIQVVKGTPQVLIAIGATPNACVVLAGGIAAEKLEFGDYDVEASAHDQRQIAERRGGSIDQHLREAFRIVGLRRQFLRQLRKRILAKWVENQAEVEAGCNFNAGADSLDFDLVSEHEIAEIWSEAAGDH